MTVARVHSVETFGTLDGPGIRFVAFFQGCHLRCQYCHNRDLWEIADGTEYTPQQLIREVKRYQPYFTSSGGGLTASGGEPLLQAPALTEIFRLAQKAGIHTCLDTSGALKINKSIEELLSYTDLVLLDLKHIQDDKHQKLVGLSNKYVLQFAKTLDQLSIPTWVRHVVIPGITDGAGDCTALADFINTLSNVEQLTLLAFHQLGAYKWEQLGQSYDLADAIPPSNEDMARVQSYFSQLSIPVIGR